jgi:hypothetical protein
MKSFPHFFFVFSIKNPNEHHDTPIHFNTIAPRHLFVLQADSVLVTSSLLVKKNVDHAIIANGDFAIRNQVTGQDIKNSIENTGTDDVLPPSV